MNGQGVIRAFVVAGASVMTAWWLLREPAEPQGGTPSLAAPAGGADARVEELPRDERRHRSTDAALAVESESAAAAVDEASAAAASDAAEDVQKIPLIEGITLPGGMWNLHAMMEREARDGAWADDMERQFSTYFASKQLLGHSFSQPTVLCRSHFCEIQAVGYGPRAFDTWSAATEDLRDQPWARQLRAGGIYTIERAPNEQAVVLILMRPRLIARQDERRSSPAAR
jgi:hypothetical protein